MEQSGRNRRQTVAYGPGAKTAEQAKTVAVGCQRLPEKFHGKEAVDVFESGRGLCKSAARRRSFVVGTCSCCGVIRCGSGAGENRSS
jgi:hypothetical protein